MTTQNSDRSRPRFLMESALVALLLTPVLLFGVGISAEWDLTKLILTALLYGWLGRRVARHAGRADEAAFAGSIAGGLAALVASVVQIGTVGPVVMTLARDLVPPAVVPAVLGVFVVLGVAWGVGFGALASWVGFLVFRSKTSDAKAVRLFIDLLRIRGALHADPVVAARSLSTADALEDLQEQAARKERPDGVTTAPPRPLGRRLKERARQVSRLNRIGVVLVIVGLVLVALVFDVCSLVQLPLNRTLP